ncbi:formin-binding protein [Marasmius tenuissimus]|uniref:Formin-binding protein n=1 Tax=Marasmius tenuissimus TaxID=585030 RepID=A0ABR2ZV46_9AGAR|nr:formin-binding protein [Marasmius tenuissimus]
MVVRSQSSTSSLAKYAVAKSPGVDLYNGSKSRDFCNSFWGAGDAGTNILFARMRGAVRTTDGLRNFWKERAAIEEEYAKKLYELSRTVFGKDEVGELRNALDTVHLETEKMAKAHLDLAGQIRNEMEESTAALLNKQLEHRKVVQAPVEKKFKTKQAQESYVVKAREKYESDRVRIASYSKAIEQQSPDADRIKSKLKRAEQTVGLNERDYENFCNTLADMLPGWESDWKDFCDSCQDMEEERMDFMKDNLWAYANAVSVVCVADDVSCEAIRTVLDQLETERDIETFVQEYGTGNAIPNAPEPKPIDLKASSSSTSLNLPPLVTSSRPATFARKSRRPAQAPYQPPEEEALPPPSKNGNASVVNQPVPTQQPPKASAPPASPPPTITQPPPPVNTAPPIREAPPAQTIPPPPPAAAVPPTSYPPPSGGANLKRGESRRDSTPLPAQPSHAPYTSTIMMPPPPMPEPQPTTQDPGRPILFYVEALYDYTATIDEEFSFQAGDIIAVTATPDDGWWSGELLDENRRMEGRHVFPSNFVRLF